jgi:hypothetical protein
MLARILHALPGAIGLTALAYLTGVQQAGMTTGGAAAAIVITLGLVLGITAPDHRVGLRRQLQFGSALFGLHAAGLYTFGTRHGGAVMDAGAQGMLAVMGALGCAWFAARLVSSGVTSTAMAAPARASDPDDTLEIAVTEPARDVVIEPPAPPPLRGALVAGIAGSALLVLATLYWLGEDDAGEALSSAAATEVPLPVAAPRAPGAGSASVPDMDAILAAVAAARQAAAPAISLPESAPGSGVAVAPSAARRECMAQIESARLFLQLAHQSDNEAAYSLATEEQIARTLKTRPVGPRTLARIAERMWERRSSPEREPSWWSQQFTRCEQARSSGSWYVVRS